LVRETFDREAAALGGAAETVVTEEIRAYRIREDEYPVVRLTRAMARLGMGAPSLITTFGGSDNNRFAANGIRGVVLACAMFDVHTVHEYTQTDPLAKSAGLVTELMTMEDAP
jgi:tripeptide aminopeptidase